MLEKSSSQTVLSTHTPGHVCAGSPVVIQNCAQAMGDGEDSALLVTFPGPRQLGSPPPAVSSAKSALAPNLWTSVLGAHV